MADASDHRIILWSRKRPDFFSELRARFNTEGDLVVDGQDIGGSVEEFFGSDEYEYFITVRKADVEKVAGALAQALGETVPSDVLRHEFVLGALKRAYSEEKAPLHFVTSSDYRAWLEGQGIKSEFTSWT